MILNRLPVAVRTAVSFSMLFIIPLLLLTSCVTKEKGEQVYEDEMREVFYQYLSPNSGGFVLQAENNALMAAYSYLLCNSSDDTTYTGSGTVGEVTYNYDADATRTLQCNPSKTYYSTYYGHTSFTASKMSSKDSCTGVLAITGLTPDSSAWKIDITYRRSGTQQSQVRNPRSLLSYLSVISHDLRVDKTTHKIISGKAAFSFTTNGADRYYLDAGGSIIFEGSNKATIKMSDRKSYTIEW